jgi:ribosomal protein S18 acetylase RimI-like enzyme
MDFTIRPATEEDLPAMMCLWRENMDFHARVEPRLQVLPPPEGEQAWEAHVRRDVLGCEDWCTLVAETDGRVTGMIMGILRDPYPVFRPQTYGEVMNVAVDPAARRNGVGRALFEALKDWFRERGVLYLQMTVAHHNPVSQAFWRAMGCTDYMDQMWHDLEAK